MSEENERLYEETQRRLREVTTLYEASQACLSISDQKGLLTAIIEAAARATDAALGSVMLIDEDEGEYVFGAHYGLSEESIVAIEAELHILLGEGLVGSVITTSQPLVVADVTTDPRWIFTETKERMRSFLGVPLVGKDGQPLGALTLSHPKVGAFDEDHARLLSAFANQAALAIENARLYEQAQARSRYLETLQKINATLRSTLPLDKVLTTIAQGAGEALHYVGSLILVPDASGERLTLGAVWGTRFLDAAVRLTGLEVGSFSLPLTAGGNPIARAYLSGALYAWSEGPERIVVGIEPPINPKLAPVIQRAMGARLAACIPLPVGEKVVGVLVVFSPRERLSDEERAMLLGLADQAGLAIENARLYEQMQQEMAERKRAIEAYRALVEHSLQGLAILQGHNVVFANPAVAEMLGYTITELISLSSEELRTVVHPEDQAFVWGRFRDRLEGKPVPPRYEFRMMRKDGTVRWVEMSSSRIEYGGLPAIQAAFVDITERKQAEEALRESEEKFRNLAEQSPNMIFINKRGRVVYANKKCEEIMGYKREEFYSPDFDFLTLIAPEYIGLIRASFSRHTKGEDIPPYEYALITKEAKRIESIITTKLIRYEGGSAILGIVTDITERVQAEVERERLLSALQHRSIQLQAAAEVSKSASTILDPEELMNQVVNLLRERFGFYYGGLFLVDKADEYAVLQAGTGEAGRQMLKIGHRLAVGGESMIGWSVANAQARIALDVGKEAVRFDNPYLPETRSEMALPLISHGQCIGALTVQSTEESAFSEEDIAVLQTMTDQLAIAIENARLYKQVQRYATELEERVAERTAELTAVNKELEAFAYSVSHDLRAPLRGIDGFSQALLEDCADKLGAEGRDYLLRVRAASHRMGQLIDDLLKLSRVTRAEMRRETVNLSGLAQKIAAELHETQPERQVEFVIAEGLVAHGDPRLLRVVLENLLDNAWKFTSKHPRARIEFGVTQIEGQPAYFVRDDGAGFDMTYADKLFGAFQRLHSMTEFEGTGIGLATVQRIIHRHGGRVWAEGAVEQGAIFYFTL